MNPKLTPFFSNWTNVSLFTDSGIKVHAYRFPTLGRLVQVYLPQLLGEVNRCPAYADHVEEYTLTIQKTCY